MLCKIIQALPEHKAILQNLMQLYMYDFSEYTKADVETDGRFGEYAGLTDYWAENNHRFAYIIKNNENIAGFVLIKQSVPAAQNCFSIAEFFILKKYRRTGIGKAAAVQVFDIHKGKWKIHQMENNKPAQLFWITMIDEYTNKQFTQRLEHGKTIQEFVNE